MSSTQNHVARPIKRHLVKRVRCVTLRRIVDGNALRGGYRKLREFWLCWLVDNSPMTRAEFVQRLILNSICDDLENVDQVILRDVAEVAAKCGLTIHRPEVVEGLGELVSAGLAKAYELSARRDALELDGMPPLGAVEEDFKTYFYVTKKGMDFREADATWWPLDDDGAIRPDWKPPAP